MKWVQGSDIPEPQQGHWLVTVEQKSGRQPDVPSRRVRTFYHARRYAPGWGYAWVEDDKFQSEPGSGGKILAWSLVPWWPETQEGDPAGPPPGNRPG